MTKILIIIISMCFVACSQKKDGVRTLTGHAVITNGTGALVGNSTCPQGVKILGSIIDSTTLKTEAGDFTGTFQERVNALLSTTAKPESIGLVSGFRYASTGIDFNGLIKLDANGNVLSAQSNLTFTVRDSIWADQVIWDPKALPINIIFDQGHASTISGQFNINSQSGPATLVLHDGFGDILFDGVLDAQNFSGKVRYVNSVTVVGQIMKGPLGDFIIPRCAILP